MHTFETAAERTEITNMTENNTETSSSLSSFSLKNTPVPFKTPYEFSLALATQFIEQDYIFEKLNIPGTYNNPFFVLGFFKEECITPTCGNDLVGDLWICSLKDSIKTSMKFNFTRLTALTGFEFEVKEGDAIDTVKNEPDYCITPNLLSYRAYMEKNKEDIHHFGHMFTIIAWLRDNGVFLNYTPIIDASNSTIHVENW